MLPSSERDLVARDGSLSGLRLLLDAEAFAAALRASWPGRDVRDIRLSYLRYKAGTSCLAAFDCAVDGRPLTVHAVTYRGADKINKRLQRPAAQAMGVSPFVLSGHPVVVHVWPDDPELRALVRLEDRERCSRLLRRAAPDARDLWDGTVTRLQYKPQRRFVGQLAVESRAAAVVKCYTPSDFLHADTATRIATPHESALSTAPRLGSLARRGVVVQGWMPGERLSDLLASEVCAPSVLERVGVALAALHGMEPPRAMRALRAGVDAAALVERAETLAFLLPDEAQRARWLARRAAQALENSREPLALVHGDCYAKQFLLTDERVTLIDFDEAGIGTPASDVGLFVAHLERDAARGIYSPSRAAAYTQALIAGYARAAGEEPLIAPHVAAGILTLAHHPFRHREPNWDERIGALLDRASWWLSRAPMSVTRMVAG